MRISKRGVEFIKDCEGFSPFMYHDAAGLPTIGYGTLIDSPEEMVYMTKPITREKAEEFLMRDLAWAEDSVDRLVTSGINQSQFDALVSFCYNVGSTKFNGSTLLRRINNDPDDKQLEFQFMRWIYAGGKRSEGLENRRKKEVELYFSEHK